MFYWKGDAATKPAEIPYHYNEIMDSKSLEGFVLEFDTSEYFSRFAHQHILCAITDGDRIISSGWVNPNGAHYLGELDLNMTLGKELDVLYDFNTLESYRGQGLYPSLLQLICNRNAKIKLIYAFPKNLASVKGIKKAGFTFIGNLYGYNKEQYLSLISKYGQIHF